MTVELGFSVKNSMVIESVVQRMSLCCAIGT